MESVQVQDFAMLDLLSDPPENHGAVAMRNIDPTNPQVLRTRPGIQSLTAGGSDDPVRLFAAGDSLFSITALHQVRLFDSSYAITGIGTVGGGATEPASLGTPTASWTFFASPSQQLQRYAAGIGMGNTVTSCKPWYVCTTPQDNRLVQARYDAAADAPGGALGTNSTVFVSDAGNPDSYGANNYIHLHPGDGEAICGVVAWRELWFVFKTTRMFVFYGTSTDATGNPIFNYRTVNLPAPLLGLDFETFRPMCAGPDGVYFATRGGIYRTSGADVTLVSEPVTPIFDRTSTSDIALQGNAALLAWANGQLFCSYQKPVGGNHHRFHLVRGPTGAWALWDLPSTGWHPIAEWDPSTAALAGPGTIITATTSALQNFSYDATDDDGTAIESYYQAGWTDLGSPNDKRIREVAAWGSGTPTISLFTDRNATDTSEAAVTLGTAPAVTRAVHAKARTGREFSWKVSATEGAFNISSLEFYIADQRVT